VGGVRQKQKKQRKKPHCRKQGIRIEFDYQRRRIEIIEVCMGVVSGIILHAKFHQNRLSGFRKVGSKLYIYLS